MIDVDKLGSRVILSLAGGKIPITESTLFGIVIAVIIGALGIWLGSGLKDVPKGKQVIAEYLVEKAYKFTVSNMGEENTVFAPYVGTIFAFILMGSSLGLFGIRPITADLNVTFALSVMTFFLILVSSVRRLGVKGKLKKMCDPYPFMFPLKIMEDVTLPISLALRLFGNILGGTIIVDLWMRLMERLSGYFTDVPFLRAVTVLPLNAFFDIFEPVIQTIIFTMLTMVFLKSAMENPAGKTGKKNHKIRR